jgi:hypothetical protein
MDMSDANSRVDFWIAFGRSVHLGG